MDLAFPSNFDHSVAENVTSVTYNVHKHYPRGKQLTDFCVLKLFLGDEFQLLLTIAEENGVETVFQPDYENLNSEPAKAFVESFTNSVFWFFYFNLF